MKKILYAAASEHSLECLDGVGKKIQDQCNILKQYFDVFFIAYSHENVIVIHKGQDHDDVQIVENKNMEHHRMLLYRTIKEYCQKQHFDLVLFRYGYSDPYFIKLCKLIHEYSRIIVEIPSYPYNKEVGHNLKKRLHYVVDCVYRTQLKKYVSRIICSYKGDRVFGIPTIQSQNGIVVSRSKMILRKVSDEIHLICVSSMEAWHGYERLILGLTDYYRNGGKRNIVLDIVGQGKCLEQYKTAASSELLNGHVKFHGFMTGEALDEIYQQATAAVTSLGLHRINIYDENTIKTREYAAKGMLIITGAQNDMFRKDYPYLLRVPADESNIKINDVLSFIDKFTVDSSVFEDATKNIRRYAEKYFDMSVVMKPIIDYIANK